MSSTTHQPLNYSPLQRGRKTTAYWLVICISAVIIFRAYDWGPRLVTWAKGIHTQWQFLRHTAPSDRVVVETEDARAKMLLARPGYVPASLTGHVDAFYADSIPQQASGLEAVLFLHERMTPSGERRLVSLSIALNPTISLYTATYRPTWHGLQRVRRDRFLEGAFQGRVNRIFAGQADPADPTHFTIRYEAEGQQRVLDGWLQDDDSLKFQDRGLPRGFFSLWPSY